MLAALLIAAAVARHPDPGFAVRIVKMSGDPASASTRAHVRFCRDLGFNALWVESWEAGAWTKKDAPDGPRVAPEFVHFARWCKRRGLDLWVAIRPVADSSGDFVFSDPDRSRRLEAFASQLGEKAGVRHIVLALDDAPATLHELSDIFRYGTSAAPAHLELTRRLAGALSPNVSLWLQGAASSDRELGDGSGPYAKPFLAGLAELPKSVGLVWSGPEILSPKITKEGMIAAQSRLGGRPIVLHDNFPTDDLSGDDDAMALLLPPLSGREPGIRDAVAGYVVSPALPLAGSRLTLLTIARFLEDPATYDPATATQVAIARLAGGHPAAAIALDTQQLEWGGALAGLNYWPRSLLNPALAAGRLNDPAFVDSFTWTVDRYPGRMSDLAHLDDGPFRDALLGMMRRRLAIGRAMPLTIDYLRCVRNGDPESAAILARIETLRRETSSYADAGRVLELFLTAASVPKGAKPP